MNTVTATLTRRHSDPFGASRDPVAVAWPDGHGYLNKPIDAVTGTVHLGAREYDPVLGRFLSVDPVLSPMQPQQNNGYSYAWNNPIGNADPSGLEPRTPGHCFANDPSCNNTYGGSQESPGNVAGDPCIDYGCRPHQGPPAPGNADRSCGDICTDPSQTKPWIRQWCESAGNCNSYTPEDFARLAAEENDYHGFCRDGISGLDCATIWLTLVTAPFALFDGVELGIGSLRLGLTAADDAATVGVDAAKSCLNSFTGDTPVTMADGSEKPIEDVGVGNKVLATDPQTGMSASEPVVALIRHAGKHTMVDITLADGSVLTATDGQPIWDATKSRFTDAAQLQTGDKIETDTGGLMSITSLATYSADLTAYNLQIGIIHTYYAGTTPILVHNSCGDLSKAARQQLGKLADQSNSSAADVIRSRGGGASQVNQLQSGYGQLSLGDLATRAAAGDKQAVKALKMIKQAGSQGKGGK
ncbi:MAG TPA: RHS repeat-associated core domain-containing protein [Jatrophihabitans sp.]|jgi:RHS repeat-associated protein